MKVMETVGWIIAAIGWIWLVVMGFRYSILWGILNLLIPIVAVVFGIVHFPAAKTPLIILLVGVILAALF
jgi:hypothetical protein